MHYYQFNIGDYASHTKGLSLLEDLAYRRLIDEYYLQEKPFLEQIQEIARLIGMNEYLSEVGYVLNRFFIETNDGWTHKRIDSEIQFCNEKSAKARASAKIRWEGKAKDKRRHTDKDATALQETEKAMLPITHNPIPNTHNSKGRFSPPSKQEISEYCLLKGLTIDEGKFFDFYESKGWMVGKNKMKDWKAAIRNWARGSPSSPPPQNPQDKIKQLTDRGWAE